MLTIVFLIRKHLYDSLAMEKKGCRRNSQSEIKTTVRFFNFII